MGDLKLAMFLAYKSIFRGNRWALTLIVIIMSLSFANLLLVPSILVGVTETINRQQVDTLYGDIIIDPLSSDHYLSGVSAMVETLQGLANVSAVAPRIIGSAFFEYEWREKGSLDDRGKSGTWSVVGIDPDSESLVTSIHLNMVEGQYLDPGDRDAIILGVEIAGGTMAGTAGFETLQGAGVGDSVRLTYPNGVQREYTVKGLFRARESRADRTAYVTRTEMASVMGRPLFHDRASQLLVKTREPAAAGITIDEIRATGVAAEVRSWESMGALWEAWSRAST
jgi:hypothetical protein